MRLRGVRLSQSSSGNWWMLINHETNDARRVVIYDNNTHKGCAKPALGAPGRLSALLSIVGLALP